MVGPLKGGSHKKKYLLVMVDKFAKCIEAKPVKTGEAGPVIALYPVLCTVMVSHTASSLTTAPISQPMR